MWSRVDYKDGEYDQVLREPQDWLDFRQCIECGFSLAPKCLGYMVWLLCSVSFLPISTSGFSHGFYGTARGFDKPLGSQQSYTLSKVHITLMPEMFQTSPKRIQSTRKLCMLQGITLKVWGAFAALV